MRGNRGALASFQCVLKISVHPKVERGNISGEARGVLGTQLRGAFSTN